MSATAHMPLLERLRKGANCVVFLDGAPEPAADVADMLLQAACEIEQLRGALKQIVDMEPSEIAPETFPGVVHGSALLFANSQRIARAAMAKGKQP